MSDKKFVKEYQPTDSEGKAIGPKQRFEADTAEELMDKLAAAHQSASGRLYETMRASKLGILMEPDPDQPINEFKERLLTADERIKITASLQDPATAPDAIREVIESVFGANVDTVRAKLRSAEVRDRVDFIKQETDKFIQDHPEYYGTKRNQDTILKWLNKKGYAITANNLERAYADLASVEGVLDIAPVTEPPLPVPAPAPAAAITAASTPGAEVPATPPTPSSEAIPPATTAAPQNSGSPAEVRPSKSSSGLSRNDASGTTPPSTAKAPEITAQEIRRMSSAEYDERLQRDPVFAAAVDKLFKR